MGREGFILGLCLTPMVGLGIFEAEEVIRVTKILIIPVGRFQMVSVRFWGGLSASPTQNKLNDEIRLLGD